MNNVIANRDRIIRRLTKLLSTNHEIDRLRGKKERLNSIMNEMAKKADSAYHGIAAPMLPPILNTQQLKRLSNPLRAS